MPVVVSIRKDYGEGKPRHSMSFLYSLKKNVGRGRIYIIWDNFSAHSSKHVYGH
jgi:hypothetical protein